MTDRSQTRNNECPTTIETTVFTTFLSVFTYSLMFIVENGQHTSIKKAIDHKISTLNSDKKSIKKHDRMPQGKATDP